MTDDIKKQKIKDPTRGPLGVDKPTRVSPTDTLGDIGVAIYSGFIQSNEKDSTLTGQNRYITYSENLVNISIVGAGVRFFLNMVARAVWSAVPSDEKDIEAVDLAEKFEKIIFNMNTPWSRVVRRAAMFKFYGFNIQEWTAKKQDDGIIGYLDVEPRSNATIERWDTNDRGDVVGVVQRSPQNQKEIYLPREKVVYMVDDSLSDSPEGLGIFRHIAALAKRLLRYEQLEGFGFESDLRGTPVGKAPLVRLAQMKQRGEISAEDFEKIVSPLRSFVSNHIKTPNLGILLDSSPYTSQDSSQRPSSQESWSVELLKGSPGTQQDMNIAINRINHEIARLIGTQHLLLGADGKGTQALSRDISGNFFLIIESALRELSETFEKDLVNPIWEMNSWPEDKKPSLRTSTVQIPDVEQISNVLRNMSQAGAVLAPDDPAINEVRELLGLSRVDMTKLMEDMGLNNVPLGNIVRTQDEEVPKSRENPEE